MSDQNEMAEIIVLGRNVLGPIEGLLFGQFFELGGRCVNNGVFEPDSPRSRQDGVRTDVLEALQELKVTHLRYPGGCGASYFKWEELVGPVAERPRAKLYRMTGASQSTAVGIPEAYDYCQELGAEFYLVVNAHVESPDDAANLVEYLNGTTPTRYADLRRAHGREAPYNVKIFGLGNEIYGDWQNGQMTAEEYGRWFRQAAIQMKRVDPTIKLIACGAGRVNPEWDRTVLFETLGYLDMISMHNYVGRPGFRDCMAACRVLEEMLAAVNVAIDEAMDTTLGAHPRTRRELGEVPQVDKRPTIAFDEWNVWYREPHTGPAGVEEKYDYTDALTIATIFHFILRNTKTIELSNISLAVNLIGHLFTDSERCVRQTTWYTQKLMVDHHRGSVVDSAVDAPLFSAKHERFFCGIVDPEKAKDENLPTLLHYDDIPALDVLVSIDRESKTACMSVVQKLEEQPLTVALTFCSLQPTGDTIEVARLTGESPAARNTLDEPHNVGITTETAPRTNTFTFPPASLTFLTFNIE
jgi:alpha-N-arabinofuranosidase